MSSLPGNWEPLRLNLLLQHRLSNMHLKNGLGAVAVGDEGQVEEPLHDLVIFTHLERGGAKDNLQGCNLV